MCGKHREPNRPAEPYEHRDNNPPVGLVTPDNDPDARWQEKIYACHLYLDQLLVWAGSATSGSPAGSWTDDGLRV